MERAYLEIIFLCGMVLQVLLLLPYFPDYLAKKYRHYFNKKERQYLILIFIGYLTLPFIYVFSTWFSWFDYNLPKWLGFPAVFLFGFGFWLFYKSYNELGSSWSPGFDVRTDSQLIVTGLYRWVRHPMYAAFLVVAVSQLFMLQNWMIGPSFLLLAIPFYRYRILREEQRLVLHFGDEYINYRKQTNALIPKIDQLGLPRYLDKFKVFASEKLKSNFSKRAK